MSHDIFHKICGRCLAKVPLGASACDCGYSFGRDGPASDTARTGEISNTVSQERQYETYFEARLQQALDRLRAVRQECGLDKWTPEQDQKVQQALQALQNARKELNAQRRRTADAEKEAVLKRARRGLRTAAPPSKRSARRNTENARITERSSATPAVAGKPMRVAHPGDRRIVPPTMKAPHMPANPESAPAVRAFVARASRTASSVRAGNAPAGPPTGNRHTVNDFMGMKAATFGSPLDPLEQIAAPVSPQTPSLKRAADKTRNLPAAQPLTVTPARLSRNRPAGPARPQPEDNKKPRPAPVRLADRPPRAEFPTPPGEAFRAAQTAKTELARPSPGNTQQCPHCTAMLPAQAERCGCGYEFPDIGLFPAIKFTA